MLKENDRLLEELSVLFLESEDPDKSYLKVIRVIKRLNNIGIDINVGEVQIKAYKCGKGIG